MNTEEKNLSLERSKIFFFLIKFGWCHGNKELYSVKTFFTSTQYACGYFVSVIILFYFKGFYDLCECFWARSWYSVVIESTHTAKLDLYKIIYLLSTRCHDNRRNFTRRRQASQNVKWFSLANQTFFHVEFCRGKANTRECNWQVGKNFLKCRLWIYLD